MSDLNLSLDMTSLIRKQCNSSDEMSDNGELLNMCKNKGSKFSTNSAENMFSQRKRD
jgi:hypothetical protein